MRTIKRIGLRGAVPLRKLAVPNCGEADQMPQQFLNGRHFFRAHHHVQQNAGFQNPLRAAAPTPGERYREPPFRDRRKAGSN